MSITQLNDKQIKDTSIGIADLSATGIPSSTTYLRGDNVWSTVTAVAPDIPLSILTASVNQVITAGYCANVIRKFKINSGIKLTIGLGAIFKIE